jgi:DNA polymerase-3 subunit beta
MEFNISKEGLLKSLQPIHGIADRRNTMPILSNVLLDCDENRLKLFATDLEVSLENIIEINTKVKGKTTAPAKKLFEIVKELPEGDINISSDENYNISILSNNISFKLRGLPYDEFPSLPKYEETSLKSANSKILKEMIDKTVFSSATEDIQFNLSGIYIERPEDQMDNIRFVATDGHRLALIDRTMEFPAIENKGIIVPRKGIIELRRMITNDEIDSDIALDNNQLIARHQNTVLFIRLIDGVFPNYREVIPEENPKKIVIKRDRFLESIRRASIVSIEKFRGVKFEISDNLLTLSSNNPDVGESEEKIEVDYGLESMSISFNSRYFIDVLTALDTEELTLELKDEQSPALIRDSKDDKFMAVIMPMRL